MSAWQVGQQVIVRTSDYRGRAMDEPATITRAGTKYVYIQRYGRDVAFDRETGVEHGEGGYKSRLFTAESLAEHDRTESARVRLRLLTSGYMWTGRLSADVMEQVADLIEGDQP